MRTLIYNVQIICDHKKTVYGGVIINDKKIESVIEDIDKSLYADCNMIDGNNHYLMPGFIDIHLHGSYGYDFIGNPQDSVSAVAKGLPKEATTSFLASLTLLSHQDLCTLLSEYAQIKNVLGAHFLGIHSEGPFLSKKYKALMNENHIKDPNVKQFEEMIKSSNGRLKVMTLAPELKNASKLIDLANKYQVKLMIGHTACTCDDALKALSLGCKGFTHLYNAMTQHTHRTPGAVTAAFLDENCFTELIVDGFHVDLNVVLASYQILTSNKIVLVSDAMLAKGMEDGEYVFSDLKTRKTNNTVQVIDTGRIAGSAISMLDAAKLMHQVTNCSMNEITQMASINPAKILEIDSITSTIEVGKNADLIIVDSEFNLYKTFVAGELMYQK